MGKHSNASNDQDESCSGCAPEVGSDRWCEVMGEKPKAEWTASDAASFTKHCVLGLKPGE
ncbi:MAG: DUF3012 domain-containing protein [Gammaproteobacteria bacterium]